MSWRRRGLLGLGGLGSAALLLWGVTWLSPSWWRPPEPGDRAVADLAQALEAALVEEAHRIRADDSPWSVRMSDEQVNAWLAARLPRWIAHDGKLRWPDGLGLTQIRAHAGSLDIGVQQSGSPESSARAGRVASLRLVVEVEKGRLWLQLRGVGLGRLPLPGGAGRWVVAALRARLPSAGASDKEQGEKLTRLLRVLSGEGAIEASIKLADDRVVRLAGVSLDRGEILLTCRTLPAGPRTEGPAARDP